MPDLSILILRNWRCFDGFLGLHRVSDILGLLAAVGFLPIFLCLEQAVELRVRRGVRSHVVVRLSWFVDYIRVHV